MIPLSRYLSDADMLKYPVHGDDNDSQQINIVGWRNSKARVDNFDCWVSVYFKNEKWRERHYQATTYPGTPWLLNPMVETGTAVVVPDFYPDGFKLGMHRNRYQALVQNTEFKVFRDNNKNNIIDYDPKKIYKGYFGIQIHRAGIAGNLVGVSSAGCQVLKNKSDLEDLISLCKRDEAFYGNKFNYTLMEF